MKKITVLFALLFILLPVRALALQMPSSGSELAEMNGISAKAYAVMDINTGRMLIQKNADAQRTAASLTKLVTAMVVLDARPKLSKVVTMDKKDQAAGSCSAGGVCIRSAHGVKFTLDNLFHAAMLPSANNAASALARSSGLTTEQFAEKMNQKARSLGAVHTTFVEPTGMDPNNHTTAADYVKIITAAYKNNYLRKIAQKSTYALRSANNARYSQTIKNTDKLLANEDVKILVAKTGYLTESQYNFGSVLRYHNRDELAVVVLGVEKQSKSFEETTLLAKMAEDAKFLTAFR